MKSLNFSKNTLVLSALLIMITIGLTSMKPITDYDPVGLWDYEVETNDGTLTGEITIEKDDGEFAISVETTQYGTLELENITLEKNEMTADVEIEGATIDFSFNFDGDSMEGEVTTPDGDLDITAERRTEE